ncbi:MAG: thiamine phosphate synthase [Candidatus Eisenbacteria bacterium]
MAPRLLVVTDTALMGDDPVGAVRELFAAHERARPEGAARWMLQWRDKSTPTRENYARLLALGVAPVPIVVNDRVDLALAVGHGVHLTETSLPTRVARSLLPAGALVGRSTHSLDAALRAEAEGADYVVFGPIFDTPSKRAYGAPLGLDALREAAQELAIPVLAIGGIGLDEIPSCLASGAHGVAMIRALWSADDRPATLARLLAEIDASLPGSSLPS